MDELLAAYPNAKVILSARPPDAWLKSLRRTVFPLFNSRHGGFCHLSTILRTTLAPPPPNLLYTFPGREQPWKPSAEQLLLQLYESHNQYVRRVVPHCKLLEYRPGDGWRPLCSFLDIPVPEQHFPHTNAQNNFVETENRRYWSLWRKVALFLIKISAAAWMTLFFTQTVYRFT